jgi:hypothetical protein
MRIILLFLLCLFSESAMAQTDCQSLPKASTRLACYDKISPPGAMGKPATSKSLSGNIKRDYKVFEA